MVIAESPKNRQQKFICIKCDYKCSKESDYNKHLNTSKHARLINVNGQLIEKSHIFKCSICYKEYKSNVGLWKHKKKCIPPTIIEETVLDPSSNEIKVLSNLVLEVIKNNNELQKQNHDLQQKMFELYKNNLLEILLDGFTALDELVHEVDDITADGKITKEEIEHLRNKIKMLERIAAEKQQQ